MEHGRARLSDMILLAFQLSCIVALIIMSTTAGHAQSAENKNPTTYSRSDEEQRDIRPLSMKETLEKMRVAKEKKEHKEMLERGEEVLRISEQLETAFAANGRLSDKEFVKLAAVEKIVKKIRSELGGDGDDSDKERSDETSSEEKALSPADAVKSLRKTTLALFDELKKTTRFTISAAAIQSSNAVLKLARFLRIAK